jgi:hypothetical protein
VESLASFETLKLSRKEHQLTRTRPSKQNVITDIWPYAAVGKAEQKDNSVYLKFAINKTVLLTRDFSA